MVSVTKSKLWSTSTTAVNFPHSKARDPMTSPLEPNSVSDPSTEVVTGAGSTNAASTDTTSTNATSTEAAISDTEGSARVHEKHGFFLVGIGASAGGVAACKRFFEAVRPGFGMAYVVVLHLSEEHESHMAEILQNVTTLKVIQVMETVKVVPDHVYVIPPTHYLAMEDGHIVLTEPQRVRGQRLQIDLFFRTLAEAYGPEAVAIVLSGSGSDGTLGLSRVKESGGFTVVQDPLEAEYDSMPRSALQTGLIDLVLPVAQIPAKLERVLKRSSLLDTALAPALTPQDPESLDTREPSQSAQFEWGEAEPDELSDSRSNEADLLGVLKLVRERTGHDFAYYKRPTLGRRIARRLQVHELPDLHAYLELLRSDPAEMTPLLQDLLITVTNFFRDPEAFALLESEVIPKLFAGKTSDDSVRVWLAGCATGEEAYSVGMLLLEAAQNLPDPPKIQIFASDINEVALKVARAGRYDEAVYIDVSKARLERFFVREGQSYRVRKELRDLVLFVPHNLLRDPPFSKLDLVLCRNLLIYLNKPTQERVLALFHFSLVNEGFLFLGSSESAEGSTALFESIVKKWRILRALTKAPNQGYSAPPSLPESRYWPGAPRSPGAPPIEGDTQAQRRTPNRWARFGELHYQLVEQLAPPSILVSESYEILHSSEHAVRFLRVPGGDPSQNLLKLALPGLMLDLRAALSSAAQEGRPTEARHVSVDLGGREIFVNVTVRPTRSSSGSYFLVILEEQETPLEGAFEEAFEGVRSSVGTADKPVEIQSVSEVLRADRAIESVVQRLETENQEGRDQMHTLEAQFEASNEELKVSNEELQALVEELRSASEELETGKEESQSLNEELSTVNGELKEKMDEAVAVNNDLKNLMSSTDLSIIFLDASLRIKRFTARALDVFKLIDSDVGRPLADLTHTLDYDELLEDAVGVLRSQQALTREVSTRSSGNADEGDPGSNKTYMARLTPYRTLDGEVDGVVLSFIDISETKAALALRQSEAHLRAIIGQATAGIAQMTEGGSFTLVNARYAEMTGYSESELLGRTLLELTHPDDVGALQSHLTQLLGGGPPFTLEQRCVRRNGEAVWLSKSVSLVQGPVRQGGSQAGGRERTLVVIAIDLTERKGIEAALLESDHRKDEFLGTLSHELRNPLNALRSNVELMRYLSDVSELQAARAQVEPSLEMIQRLVDDLLDVTRISRGKLRVESAPLELSRVLRASADTLRSKFQERGIALNLALTESAKPGAGQDLWLSGNTIYGDAVRLEQVFTNLLSNALKFSPPGSRVTLSAQHYSFENGGEVRVEVRDEGIGLSPLESSRVFELFAQVAPTVGPAQDGLGIGLYLVQRIVELHGGSVGVNSAGPGKGSVFTVYLPTIGTSVQTPESPTLEPPTLEQTAPTLSEVAPLEATSPLLENPEPSSVEPTILEPAPLEPAPLEGGKAPTRVLLADDYEPARKAIAKLIRFMGFEVATAFDGVNALEVAQTFKPDLLLIDINMPRMSGYEVARALREQPAFAHSKLVALTGYGQPEDVRQALEAGFDLHIIKPLDAATLERLLVEQMIS